MLITLRQILGEAKRNDLCDTSPWERLEPLHVPFIEANYWTEDEQRTVLACAAGDEQQPDALLFFGLSLFTGMRRGETVSVRWCDVDWSRKPCPVLSLRERPDFRIKRHQWRDIPLCPDAVRLLTKYAPSNRGSRDHIVQPLRDVGRAEGSDSIRYDPRKLFLRVVAAATKRGVHRITLREMRHSFACTCLLQHQPADIVARMLGHRNSEMVFRHYAALLHHPEAPPLPAVLPSRLPKRT
jgi:integrase